MDHKTHLITQLNHQESVLRQAAIEMIKKEGDISIVPELLDFVVREKDNLAVVKLLADIKDNAFSELLLQRIKSTTAPEAKATLLRICWESSLDFSEYADLFASLLTEGPFEVSLEASTVLENLSSISDEKRREVINILKTGKGNQSLALLMDNIIGYFTTQEDEL